MVETNDGVILDNGDSGDKAKRRTNGHLAPEVQLYLLKIVHDQPLSPDESALLRKRLSTSYSSLNDEPLTSNDAITLLMESYKEVLSELIGHTRRRSPGSRFLFSGEEDVFAAGTVAMLEGILTYDFSEDVGSHPEGGVPENYFYVRIRREVDLAVVGLDSMQVPRYVHEKLPLAAECIHADMSFDDILNNRRLAIGLSLTTEKAWEIMRDGTDQSRIQNIRARAWRKWGIILRGIYGTASLDASMNPYDANENTWHDVTPDPQSLDPFEAVLNGMVANESLVFLKREIKRYLEKNPRRRPAEDMLSMYMLHVEGYSDEEIAKMYTVSKRTVINYRELVAQISESSQSLVDFGMERILRQPPENAGIDHDESAPETTEQSDFIVSLLDLPAGEAFLHQLRIVLISSYPTTRHPQRPSLYTEDCIKLFRLHVDGLTSKEIGAMFNTTDQTVDKYLRRIKGCIRNSGDLMSLLRDLSQMAGANVKHSERLARLLQD